MRRLGGQELDVLIGGPPCQGFSTAGWRRSNDPRNRLWQGYMDVLAALRPKWLVLENVPGMRTMKAEDQGEKRVIDIMIEEFRELGYELAVGVLNAAEFGVPQLRRRLFIIGVKSALSLAPRLPSPLLRTPLTVRDAISNLPPLGVADGEEVLELENLPPRTPYQAWIQGGISIGEMVRELAKRGRTVSWRAFAHPANEHDK